MCDYTSKTISLDSSGDIFTYITSLLFVAPTSAVPHTYIMLLIGTIHPPRRDAWLGSTES